ncbi:replication factor A protein 3-domain-containing protein [Schizophyllum amplum]|uniref:Replication factor A protein 3-domain-containing protein n=1 Tax=Schizophyllum amplum TaxID=97359 RepID=A0A550CAP2_9AGAR|nr:replication factor A protein 3-domain-containing protein [Auriculariopsis ampla]
MSQQNDKIAPFVNYARLANFQGKQVRLICKLKNLSGPNEMKVQTTDDGEVVVTMPSTAKPTSTYLEIVGLVQESAQVKMMGYIELGDDIDMKLSNDMIEQMHRPMFWEAIYGYQSETPA